MRSSLALVHTAASSSWLSARVCSPSLALLDGRRYLSKHKQHHHHHHTSEALDAVKQQYEEDSLWMKSAEGQAFLKDFLAHTPRHSLAGSDMASYIHMRAHSVKGIPAPAERMLSSLLTFPLTLGVGLQKLFPAETKKDKLNVLIVGARAESSLPMQWWKEVVIAHPHIHQLNLRLVGPGMQRNNSLHQQGAEHFRWEHDFHGHKTHSGLSVIHNMMTKGCLKDSVALHEHESLFELLHWADAFVLFNPGFGSVTMREHWAPSIKLLLETKKPVVCTAHGDHDLETDLAQLEALSHSHDDQELGEPLEHLIPAGVNPFRSLSARVHDRPFLPEQHHGEKHTQDVVVTNKYVYAFQAK